jgi:hypothetical protein
MESRTAAARPVSQPELERFTRQLGALLGAGVNILRALEVAGDQAGNPRLVSIGQGIGTVLADGRDFHQALTHYPDVFSPFYVQMMQQGEREGVLGPALLAVADYLARENGPAPQVAEQLSEPGAAPAPGGRLLYAMLLVLAGGAAGLAVLLWAAGAGSLLPADWLAPLVASWTALGLVAAARVTRRMERPARAAPNAPGRNVCTLCGRPEEVAGPLSRGGAVAICGACLRSNIAQLKTPERRQAEEAALAASLEEEAEEAASPPAPPSRNGAGPLVDEPGGGAPPPLQL